MMIEAKCCICGQVVKAPPPKNSFRYIFRCDCCGQEQFLKQLPGMEFFAAIPFNRDTTPAESIKEYSISEYAKSLGFKAEQHFDFVDIATKIAKLVEEKQKQYGDMISSMGPILKELYPDGVKPEQYNDLTIIVRMLDKIGRITKGNGAGNEDAWGDLIGYSLLGKSSVQNRRS